MNKIVYRMAALVIVFFLTISIHITGRATSEAAIMEGDIINIAHFFKPPTMDAASAATRFNSIVLTNGDHTYMAALRASGYSSTVPEYFRSEAIQDPGSCTATPLNNQVAYRPGDFCAISANHPDWFLLDSNGNRMVVGDSPGYYRMDPGNQGWREFFVNRVIENQTQYGWTGLFLDNVEASLGKFFGNLPARYPTDAQYQAAVAGFLQYIDTNYSNRLNRPVVGNIITRRDDATWFNYLQYLDGAMQERFAVNWNETEYLREDLWLQDLNLMEETQSRGKYVILIAPGWQSDVDRQKFAFASYLLISRGKAAFRYSTDDAYREVWLYDNYNIRLGNPLGAKYQQNGIWRRDFANGYVIVDPVSHAAVIATTPSIGCTSAPTSSGTAVGAGIYDDSNPAWTYSSSWQASSGSGPYNNTLHQSSTIGHYASMRFNGTQIKLTYLKAPGRGFMDVYIDNVKVTTLFTNNSSIIWQPAWTSSALSAGVHTVCVQNAGGGWIDLDAIQVIPPPSPQGAGTYDDEDPNWRYSGTWATLSTSGPYADTMHYTNATGATASFTFRAPAKFILFFQATSNRSNILVSVDGGTPVAVNAYNADNVWQQSYTSAMYSDTGSHTVTISTPGTGNYIDIDAIQVIPPPSPQGAGTYDDANANWSYSGSWATWSGSGPYANTMHYTNATGATASFTFRAPAKFILFFQATSNRSNILVSVDGGTPVAVNAYNADNVWQQSYTSAIYSDTGSHTVTISTPGTGNYIDIDAIQIVR